MEKVGGRVAVDAQSERCWWTAELETATYTVLWLRAVNSITSLRQLYVRQAVTLLIFIHGEPPNLNSSDEQKSPGRP